MSGGLHAPIPGDGVSRGDADRRIGVARDSALCSSFVGRDFGPFEGVGPVDRPTSGRPIRWVISMGNGPGFRCRATVEV